MSLASWRILRTAGLQRSPRRRRRRRSCPPAREGFSSTCPRATIPWHERRSSLKRSPGRCAEAEAVVLGVDTPAPTVWKPSFASSSRREEAPGPCGRGVPAQAPPGGSGCELPEVACRSQHSGQEWAPQCRRPIGRSQLRRPAIGRGPPLHRPAEVHGRAVPPWRWVSRAARSHPSERQERAS